jgi:hypothetical protein
MKIAFEWPSAKLPLTFIDVDAQAILGAARRARRFWE